MYNIYINTLAFERTKQNNKQQQNKENRSVNELYKV